MKKINLNKIFMPVCCMMMASSCMGTPMIHADNTFTGFDTNGEASQNVEVNANVSKVHNTGKADTVYKIEIKWTAGNLVATQTSDVFNYVWDSANAKYVLQSTKDSKADLTNSTEATVTIDITNKSNADIYYKIEGAAQTGYSFETAPKAQTTFTKIASADGGDGTNSARSNMLKGSVDATALSGSAVSSSTFTDTIKLKTVSHIDTDSSGTETSTSNTAAIYKVSLKNSN